jgi:hypothetical protein
VMMHEVRMWCHLVWYQGASGIPRPPSGDNQAQTWLIITINDTCIGDLPLIITINDTCKNQPKRLDFDNTINLSSLIVILDSMILPLGTSPWLSISVIHAKTSLKGSILIIVSTYQAW